MTLLPLSRLDDLEPDTLEPDDHETPRDDDPEQSIPLPTSDEEQAMAAASLPETLPVLALRNTVLFPGVVLPITVGRDASLKLVKDAYAGDRLVAVVAQKRSDIETPAPEDLYDAGTAATLLKLIKMPDGSVSIVIQGKRRITVDGYTQTDPYLRARVSAVEEDAEDGDGSAELSASIRQIKELAVQIVNLSPNLPSEAAYAIQNIESPRFLVHFITSNLQIAVEKKQELLEARPLLDRARLVLGYLEQEIRVLEISEEIRSKVKTDVDQQQREFFLRQQLKTIQDELGETEGSSADTTELRDKLKEKKDELPEHAVETVEKELTKLARTTPASPEYSVVRNYAETILDLPWNHVSDDAIDIAKAAAILDEDHYGLDDVKRRILEYLAVLKLKGDLKAPILCFYGPPGVGKTSLGKSIARAVGREFQRVSLGGVRDEAEIRGHRRTYVGAMPGRILQSLRRAGSHNPVFLLDEVDKLGADFRGDPSSALLEVLDPEQNHTFSDHYLEVPFDLSRVFFIATANTLSTVPPALLDRMEVIELPGYTDREKLLIARKHLVPKQRDAHGLREDQITLEDDAIDKVVHEYTREAGVRNLDRFMANLMRKAARRVAEQKPDGPVALDAAFVSEALGAPPHLPETAERTTMPGVVVGLARTNAGGDILFIEATAMPGGKDVRLRLTGHLGDVMKESAETALSWVRANAGSLGLTSKALEAGEIHLHVPAGAVPKDGPSAGVTLATALVSVLSGRCARGDVAMTGEISLRGRLLPVGGIKDKVLAASRAGIKTVILPKRNEKDLVDVPEEVQRELTIRFAESVEEVLEVALEPATSQKQ